MNSSKNSVGYLHAIQENCNRLCHFVRLICIEVFESRTDTFNYGADRGI